MTPVVMLLVRSFSRIEKYAKLRTKPPLQEPPQNIFTKKVKTKPMETGTKKKGEKIFRNCVKKSTFSALKKSWKKNLPKLANMVLKSRLFRPNDAR